MTEPLDSPPEIEEGDNTVAVGGEPTDVVAAEDLSDTDELDDEDPDDDE